MRAHTHDETICIYVLIYLCRFGFHTKKNYDSGTYYSKYIVTFERNSKFSRKILETLMLSEKY